MNLPFKPPFRVISEYRDGTDAIIVDANGDIVVGESVWRDDPEKKHFHAMTLICDTLNKEFPVTP